MGRSVQHNKPFKGSPKRRGPSKKTASPAKVKVVVGKEARRLQKKQLLKNHVAKLKDETGGKDTPKIIVFVAMHPSASATQFGLALGDWLLAQGAAGSKAHTPHTHTHTPATHPPAVPEWYTHFVGGVRSGQPVLAPLLRWSEGSSVVQWQQWLFLDFVEDVKLPSGKALTNLWRVLDCCKTADVFVPIFGEATIDDAGFTPLTNEFLSLLGKQGLPHTVPVAVQPHTGHTPHTPHTGDTVGSGGTAGEKRSSYDIVCRSCETSLSSAAVSCNSVFDLRVWNDTPLTKFVRHLRAIQPKGFAWRDETRGYGLVAASDVDLSDFEGKGLVRLKCFAHGLGFSAKHAVHITGAGEWPLVENAVIPIDRLGNQIHTHTHTHANAHTEAHTGVETNSEAPTAQGVLGREIVDTLELNSNFARAWRPLVPTQGSENVAKNMEDVPKNMEAAPQGVFIADVCPGGDYSAIHAIRDGGRKNFEFKRWELEDFQIDEKYLQNSDSDDDGEDRKKHRQGGVARHQSGSRGSGSRGGDKKEKSMTNEMREMGDGGSSDGESSGGESSGGGRSGGESSGEDMAMASDYDDDEGDDRSTVVEDEDRDGDLQKRDWVEMEFPDEVDTPNAEPAREVFAGCQGLKSFRKSPWIFPENHTATHTHTHTASNEGQPGACATPGWYSRVYSTKPYEETVKAVQRYYFESLREAQTHARGLTPSAHIRCSALTLKVVDVDASVDEESSILKDELRLLFSTAANYPLVLSTLSFFERKLSVQHYAVTRFADSLNVPVPSHTELVIQSGFRRHKIVPSFSRSLSPTMAVACGNPSGHKLHFRRFLTESSHRCNVASAVGPCELFRSPCIFWFWGLGEKCPFKQDLSAMIERQNAELLALTAACGSGELDIDDSKIAHTLAGGCRSDAETEILAPLTHPVPTQAIGFGAFITTDPDRLIIQRQLLTGYPFKIHGRVATVQRMFHNKADVTYFAPIHIHTAKGRIGRIKEALGLHGDFKATFNHQVDHSDTVCLPLYKRVFPAWPL